MKTLLLISIFVLSANAFAGDQKIKLNNASWKSGLNIQNKVEDETPVRLPSQNINKNDIRKNELKPESWNYQGPDQVDVELKIDSAKD